MLLNFETNISFQGRVTVSDNLIYQFRNDMAFCQQLKTGGDFRKRRMVEIGFSLCKKSRIFSEISLDYKHGQVSGNKQISDSRLQKGVLSEYRQAGIHENRC